MHRVDFHTHSTHSDGFLPPAKLVAVAKSHDIRYLALTDHDTLSGVDETEAEAVKSGITFIPGVEVSAKFTGGTMHILGYHINRHDPELLDMLNTFQIHRKKRNAVILEKLRDLGMDVSEAELSADVNENTVIGRPHIANLLIKKKYVSNFHDAFDRFLGHGKPAHVSKEIFEFPEVIQCLKNAGGIVCVAHPITLNLAGSELEACIYDMKNAGMDGIEVWNSKHTRPFCNQLVALAEQWDLAISGGSDYHGNPDSSVKMGRDYYGKWITKDRLSNILFR